MTNVLHSATILIALACCCTAPLAAQDSPPPDSPPPDRVELSNGDVLTGKLLAVTAENVKFHTEALGDVEIPIAEIVQLSSGHAVQLQTASGERVDGRVAALENGALRVQVDSQERSFPVADLVERRPPVQWTGSVAIGGNYSTGNTERRGAAVSANAVRRTDDTRLTGSFQWVYADDRDPTTREWNLTQRRIYGAAEYDYFLSKKLFAYGQGSLENDVFKDLDLRSTIGVGLGYQLYEQDDFKLSAQAGISYVDEKRSMSPDQSYIAARVGYGLEWKPIESLTVLSDGQIFPSLEDKDDVYARNDLRLRMKVNEALFAQFQWIVDWDNSPAPGTDPTDQQFFLSAGWSF